MGGRGAGEVVVEGGGRSSGGSPCPCCTLKWGPSLRGSHLWEQKKNQGDGCRRRSSCCRDTGGFGC